MIGCVYSTIHSIGGAYLSS